MCITWQEPRDGDMIYIVEKGKLITSNMVGKPIGLGDTETGLLD
jgi:hypothetical protein